MIRAGVLLGLALVLGGAAPHGRFAPLDECSVDPAAAAFRDKLTDAVARRDVMLIAQLAEPDIGLDFGGGAGREEFLKRLQGTAEGQTGGTWADLAEVLPLGCALEGDRLTMPWLFAQHAIADPFNTVVVSGEGVALRAAPRTTGRVIARIDWDAVDIVGGYQPERAFQRVRWGKRTGWIATRYLRSPIDYRLVAEREPGGPFRIRLFIAGD